MADHRYPDRLYHAIVANDTDLVREILEEGGNINAPRSNNPLLGLADYQNIYPLEAACKTSAEMAGLLLDAGADANVIDPYISSTPLIFALSANYEERFRVAMRLIEAGAEISIVDDNGRTALNRAVMIFDSDGPAAREKEIEVLRYLLEHCDIKSVTEQSQRAPLAEAATYNNIAAMELILDHQYMDINDQTGGYTALMRAALGGKKEACTFLLERGADRDLRSPKGKTAYEYAAEKEDPELLRCFDE